MFVVLHCRGVGVYKVVFLQYCKSGGEGQGYIFCSTSLHGGGGEGDKGFFLQYSTEGGGGV